MNNLDDLIFNKELIELLLSPQQQKIILSFMNGYSIEEIAKDNNLKLSNVKAVFNTSIKKIQLFLIKDMDISKVDITNMNLSEDEIYIYKFLCYGVNNTFIRNNTKYSIDQVNDLRIKILLPIYKKQYLNGEDYERKI